MNKPVLLGLVLAACGDNRTRDLAPDSSTPADTAPDTGPSFVRPTPFAVPLSATGPDQLQSAAAAGEGGFYAAGFAAETVTGPRFATVVKYLASGQPDLAFGTAGVVTTPLVVFGGADEIDVAVQADGKVVISGTTPSPTIALDRDLGVVRLAADGTLDATFGTAGVAVIDLNSALIDGTTVTGPDAARGLAVDPDGGIYLHAASRGLGQKSDASGPRTDTDYTVVKLTATGAIDPAFGGQSITLGATPHTGDTAVGQFRLDLAETAATPRALQVLADGSLMVSGYGNTAFSANTTQPVLYKLTSTGQLDTSWGVDGGVFHEVVLPVQTEVYSIAIHGDTFTTAGYGRAAGTTNDFISLRFHVDPGAGVPVRDPAFNNPTTGALVFDPSNAMLGSNCRNALALPGGKTLLMGSTGPSNMPAQDAVVAFVTDDGQLDPAYGGGVQVFELGADGNDQFWGAAISGSKMFVAGYQGGGMTQTETTNDDSFAVIFDLL